MTSSLYSANLLCSDVKMSHSHFQIAIFYYILILMENVYIDIEDDMMQIFCSLS